LSPIIAETYAEQLFFTFQFDAAIDEYERTIELDPEFPIAHYGKSWLLISLGRFDEARSEVRRARELDPYQNALNSAWVSYFARDYDAALREAEESGARSIPQLRSAVYREQARYAEAAEEYQRWNDASLGQNPFRVLTLAYIQARAGERAEALEILRQVEELRDDPGWNGNVGGIASVYGALGEHDRAFELLTEAFEVKSQSILNLKVDPLFDPLRADPRLDELLRKMGLG
jgi:tetratricopeptide (TPR) repeat protein